MYKVYMVLNENGEQIINQFTGTFVQVINIVLDGCLSFLDILANSVFKAEEKIIGVYYDENFLVVKNERTTYCFVAV